MTKVIAPFLFVAVSAGLFFSYIDPAYKGVQALVDLRNDLDTALNNSKELRETRERRLSEYKSLSKSDLDRLQKMLPDDVDNVRVIIELDTIAARYGITMRNFTFAREAPTPTGAGPEVGAGAAGDSPATQKTAALSFTVTAKFQDVLAFLSEVETNIRIMDVQRVAVTSNSAAKPDGTLQFNIALQTYWLP